MPSLVEFLKHILPSEGYYCWWYKNKSGYPQQGFVQTIEHLAETLLHIDAMGFDAYYACASYKTPTTRKADNVLYARSFWLDIDAGPGKPYSDADSALAALDAACARLGWPTSTVVYSGGGLHCYWQHHCQLTPAQWLPIAQQIKRVCQDIKFHCDPSRTADICSILRPIGTRNWKLESPRPVECLELFAAGIPQFDVQQPIERPHFNADFGDLGSIGDAASAIYTAQEPAHAHIAVDGCAQLRHFRDTQGNIPEPLWYANLGVLAQCVDGEALAHQWSSGHPAYTPEETGRKLEQAKTASGPTTCQRFADLNPASCIGCAFSGTSPIQLGRKVPELAAAEIAADVDEFPIMPAAYAINADYKLTHEKKDEDPAPFTHYPIYLSEVRVGEHERKLGYCFRQFEIEHGWSEWEVDVETYLGMNIAGKLGSQGAVPLNDNATRQLKTYIGAIYDTIKGTRKMRFDQFGWKNGHEAFYLGDSLFKLGGAVDTATGNNECAKRATMMKPVKGGSLAEWSSYANKLFVPGVEAQSFALLCSFGSPLMCFATSPGDGGAILSLVSPGSGSGKSTAIAGQASVWGELNTARLVSTDTDNAKFRKIANLQCIPIQYEELSERDPEKAVFFVKTFTGGRDKDRLLQDGTSKLLEQSWKTILTSASNVSLVSCLNEGMKSGEEAMSMRVFEVEMKQPPGLKFHQGGKLDTALFLNSGYAGRAYTAYLMQPGVLDWVKKTLETLMEHYRTVTGAGIEHRFLIRIVACAAVGGIICKKLGLMEFSLERIVNWALLEIKRRVHDTVKFDPVDAFVQIILRDSLNNCVIVNKPFHPSRDDNPVRLPRFSTYMRYEIEKKTMYIASEWIRTKLSETGQPVRFVADALEEAGILRDRNRRINLNAGLSLPGGPAPCWMIDMSHPKLDEVYIKEVLPLELKAV